MQDLKTFLIDTIRFYRAHFLTLSAITVPFLLLLDILFLTIYQAELDFSQVALIYLPALLVFPIYQVALILYIAAVVSGEKLRLLECFRIGLRFWAPILLLSFISAVAIAAGTLLLVIPGLIVIARIIFAEFYCIFDEMNPMDAFHASWQQTRDRQWMILAGLLIVYVSCGIPVIAVERLMVDLNVWNPLATVVSGFLSALLYPIPTIFAFRVFKGISELPISATISR
jgi:hypothetical protein